MPGSNREIFNHAHYNVIAKRIRELRACYMPTERSSLAYDANCTIVQEALDELVEDLGKWFSEDNPRFEMDTWLEATNTNGS